MRCELQCYTSEDSLSAAAIPGERAHNQQGFVLLLVLMFLLLIALLANTLLQSAALASRLSGNSVWQQELVQHTNSVLLAVAENPGNFSLEQTVATIVCAAPADAAQCVAGSSVLLPSTLNEFWPDHTVNVQVQRMAPETTVFTAPTAEFAQVEIEEGSPVQQQTTEVPVAQQAAVFEIRVRVSAGGWWHEQAMGIARVLPPAALAPDDLLAEVEINAEVECEETECPPADVILVPLYWRNPDIDQH